ncbi:hypothetical protein GAY28_00355 [Azospirillum brasilense]|nr:hypothetical protein [Azospirillum brasilense]
MIAAHRSREVVVSDTSGATEITSDASGPAPAGATGKAAEYLDKLVTESFKRELDQEENVVRSLPFFATSIGALLAFVGFARGTLPAFSVAAWPLLVYGLLACLLVSLVALIFFLYQSVRQRTFTYPMQERELIDYATGLITYYRQVAEAAPEKAEPGAEAEDDTDPVEVIERAIVDDLRKAMLDQIAAAARASRANNASRLKGCPVVTRPWRHTP